MPALSVNARIGLGALATAALATLLLARWGLSLRAGVLITVAVAFLVALLYAGVLARRLARSLDEPPPHTHGLTMDWAAPFYDAYCPWLGIGQWFRGETLRHAGIKAGERVLDVGCGTGVLTRLAAETVGPSGYVVGIDPSPGMIVMARRKVALAASRAEFRIGAIERLSFADASFDAVVSSFMLHHLPPEVKRGGLREVHRVLRPGGRLLAVDIDRPSNPLWWLLFWPLLFYRFTGPNLRGKVPAYLRAAGFAPVEVCARKYGLLSFWLAAKPARGLGERA